MSFQFPAPRQLAFVEGELMISGVSLQQLSERFGTPLYVYSGDDLRARVRMFAETFAGLPHTVCFAVKANSSLALLRLLAGWGCGFDIVSGGELERVRRAAPEALGRVVFSGVGKQAWEIDAALQAGILLFNVESEQELELLGQRARARGAVARFALRVNPNVAVDTHPYISTGLREHKFGLPIESARMLYRRAAALGGLEAAGVSVHIGSQIHDVAPFAEALALVCRLVTELRADGHPIRFIDAGGGLGIEYGQEGTDPAVQVKGYAEALSREVAGLGVQLLLEPGRFLVGPGGVLLTRVLVTKSNGGKRFIVADAGMNDLIRPALYHAHHEILPVREAALAETDSSVADLVGPVCESGDFFAHDRRLAVEPGDLLAILDAGAYGMSQSSNYNSRPRPAEVLVLDGEARLIRRRETMDDLLAPELV